MWIHCHSQSSYVQMWAEFCSDKRHLLQIPCVCFSLQGCMQTGQEARGVCCNKCWCSFLARITSLRQAILRHYHGSTSSETEHSKKYFAKGSLEQNPSLPSSAPPAQVLWHSALPLDSLLVCSCCSLTWERFPTVQTHKRTISSKGRVQEASSHPRLLLTDCFQQLFSRNTICLSAFLQIWLYLVKRCYRLRGANRANMHVHAMW